MANLTGIESTREVNICLSSWAGWAGWAGLPERGPRGLFVPSNWADLPDGVREEHLLRPVGLAYLTGSESTGPRPSCRCVAAS